MTLNILYLSGMFIPAMYIFLYVLGGALRPGYNHTEYSVSELLTPGAPNKTVLGFVQITYAALHILFGVGLKVKSKQSMNGSVTVFKSMPNPLVIWGKSSHLHSTGGLKMDLSELLLLEQIAWTSPKRCFSMVLRNSNQIMPSWVPHSMEVTT